MAGNGENGGVFKEMPGKKMAVDSLKMRKIA